MRDTAEPAPTRVDPDPDAPADVEALTSAWADLTRNASEWELIRSEFAGRLLTFARKLHDIRATFRNLATGKDDDSAFGLWLMKATHQHVNMSKDDRAAFIYLGTPEFEQHVRDVIGETEARNPRVLMAKVKRRVKEEAFDDIAPTAAQAEADLDASADHEPADTAAPLPHDAPPMAASEFDDAVAKILAHAAFLKALDIDAFAAAYDERPDTDLQIKMAVSDISDASHDLGNAI